MIKTTVVISGMSCGMCEAHVNDAIRAAFPVRKVTSSHKKGKTIILSDAPLDAGEIRKVVNATGYIVRSVSGEPVEKRSLLDRLLRKRA